MAFKRVVLSIDLDDHQDVLRGAKEIEPTEVPWFSVDGNLKIPLLIIDEEADDG